jgi:hypothetical protein
MLTFLLLAAQGQSSSNVLLNTAQSQFLLGIVANAQATSARASVQRARGVNQSVITGNLAAVTTGDQNASPLNVR